jgi:RluA family pseudouridine synthase
MRVASRVPTEYKDLPILDYLSQRFTYVSREEWQRRIEKGDVYRNDIPCDLGTVVRQADVIACDIPDFTPPDISLDYHIVYEDEWLLGINKPPNLRVHGQGKWTTANLIYHLRNEHIPAYPQAELVNRLDADTSGIVLMALDKETLRQMSRLFQDHQVTKTYLAVVHGVPAPASDLITLPIGPVQGGKVRVRQGVGADAVTRPAQTRYEVARRWEDQFALVRLWPESGRTHQLRIHMAASGHPLVGDALYQLDDEAFLGWHRGEVAHDMLLDRQALHCLENRFTHPRTGANCLISAPLPPDMKELLARLDRDFTTS